MYDNNNLIILFAIRSIMSHSTLTPAQLEENGITDNFVRFSVGIEDADDLIADLKQALHATYSK